MGSDRLRAISSSMSTGPGDTALWRYRREKSTRCGGDTVAFRVDFSQCNRRQPIARVLLSFERPARLPALVDFGPRARASSAPLLGP